MGITIPDVSECSQYVRARAKLDDIIIGGTVKPLDAMRTHLKAEFDPIIIAQTCDVLDMRDEDYPFVYVDAAYTGMFDDVSCLYGTMQINGEGYLGLEFMAAAGNDVRGSLERFLKHCPFGNHFTIWNVRRG